MVLIGNLYFLLGKTAMSALPSKTALLAQKKKMLREAPMYPILPNGWFLHSFKVRNRANAIIRLRRLKSPDAPQLPNGKSSMYLGIEGSPKYQEYLEMWRRREMLAAIDSALAAFDRLDAIREKTVIEQPSPEWYTPPEFVDMARSVLGGIDLDPASNPIAQGWVKAEKYYTKDDDGLAQPWAGRVWCNPPYGKFSKLFIERALEFYQSGQVTDCIFLVNRTGAAWYIDLTQQFTAVCQVRKRISFWTPEGKPEGSPRYYNDFLYLGPSLKKFKKVFSEVGKV